MPNRTDLLNFLIKENGFKSFLEIGTQHPQQNFHKIECAYKISVDPDPEAEATFCLTSDRYFAEQHEGNKCFQIVFIDGEHSAEQVKKDVTNAMKILADGGLIVCHDTNPETEDLTHFPRDKKGPWNGSTYKFAAGLVYAEMDYKTVNIDHGLTIIPKQEMKDVPIDCFTWETFERERWHMLNMISWEDFINGK